MTHTSKTRIALIGFGEVGHLFAKGFLATDGVEIAVYDVLIDDAHAQGTMAARIVQAGAQSYASAADAARGAAVVISAVTASSAYDVAKAAGHFLGPGQFFLDVNSVSPRTKRLDAEAVERSGANYVEAAVMAPVAPYGLKVPIVLGGLRANALRDILAPLGMRLEVGSKEVGHASALKMCRSVMVKGLEALAVECLAAARFYGTEEAVLASLGESYPGIDWEHLAGYKIGRTIQHGRRRAAEMREAAQTVQEAGIAPLMASATAERIDWVADRVAHEPALKNFDDEHWREAVDRMLDHPGSPEPGGA